MSIRHLPRQVRAYSPDGASCSAFGGSSPGTGRPRRAAVSRPPPPSRPRVPLSTRSSPWRASRTPVAGRSGCSASRAGIGPRPRVGPLVVYGSQLAGPAGSRRRPAELAQQRGGDGRLARARPTDLVLGEREVGARSPARGSPTVDGAVVRAAPSSSSAGRAGRAAPWSARWTTCTRWSGRSRPAHRPHGDVDDLAHRRTPGPSSRLRSRPTYTVRRRSAGVQSPSTARADPTRCGALGRPRPRQRRPDRRRGRRPSPQAHVARPGARAIAQQLVEVHLLEVAGAARARIRWARRAASGSGHRGVVRRRVRGGTRGRSPRSVAR